MAKQLKYGEDARKALETGVNVPTTASPSRRKSSSKIRLRTWAHSS